MKCLILLIGRGVCLFGFVSSRFLCAKRDLLPRCGNLCVRRKMRFALRLPSMRWRGPSWLNSCPKCLKFPLYLLSFYFINCYARFKFLSACFGWCGSFLYIFWNFAWEISARSAKVDALAHAWRLTSVLTRSGLESGVFDLESSALIIKLRLFHFFSKHFACGKGKEAFRLGRVKCFLIDVFLPSDLNLYVTGLHLNDRQKRAKVSIYKAKVMLLGRFHTMMKKC